MKQTLLLTALFFLSLNIVKAEGWVYSLDQAKTMAKLNNKLILIDFYADWCNPCKKMDFETWAKPKVKEQMKKMVAAKINIDYNSDLASLYGIKAIPAIVIIDVCGNVLYDDMGYKFEGEMVKLLSGFPEQVEELYRPLELLEENPKNPTINCSVASAFQNIAKSITGKGKDVFIKNSNYYFGKAVKFYKKEKNTLALERIDLLKCYNQIISEHPKQAIKALEKTDLEKVQADNKALAFFIAANAYLAVKDKTMANQYIEKLKSMEKTSVYLEELAALNPE